MRSILISLLLDEGGWRWETTHEARPSRRALVFLGLVGFRTEDIGCVYEVLKFCLYFVTGEVFGRRVRKNL